MEPGKAAVSESARTSDDTHARLRRRLLRRRDVIRLFAVGAAVGGAWQLTRSGATGSVVRSGIRMGTEVQLRILGGDRLAAESAADRVLEEMTLLESRLSRFLPDSEVGRMNRVGRSASNDPHLRRVIEIARELHALGDGAFDVSVQPLVALYRDAQLRTRSLPDPSEIEAVRSRVDQTAVRLGADAVSFSKPDMQLTLDGLAKGYIIERAVENLRGAGFPNVFLEAGGDLIARGCSPSGAPWRLGIRHPRAAGIYGRFAITGTAAERLSVASAGGTHGPVSGCAVATSGDYMQSFSADRAQHHIVDPRRGYSSPELASATVVSVDATWADGLATLAMVLGARAGRELLESLPDCEGCLITKNLDVISTSGFRLL